MYNLEGTEIRLGGAESIDQKLALIMATLKKAGNRKIRYIDLTYAGKPVIMFADTVIPAAKPPVTTDKAPVTTAKPPANPTSPNTTGKD
ncbi:MAG TPA: hypothetical protein VHS59_10220, partial [Bacillota bacterium]|nr:hypothetical protein [Bacillota bacterium]